MQFLKNAIVEHAIVTTYNGLVIVNKKQHWNIIMIIYIEAIYLISETILHSHDLFPLSKFIKIFNKNIVQYHM